MHKFLKCVLCSALFTSEEAFEQHKLLHPAFFLKNPDAAGAIVQVQLTDVSGSAQVVPQAASPVTNQSPERCSNTLDAANQLLKLGAGDSGSETLSETEEDPQKRAKSVEILGSTQTAAGSNNRHLDRNVQHPQPEMIELPTGSFLGNYPLVSVHHARRNSFPASPRFTDVPESMMHHVAYPMSSRSPEVMVESEESSLPLKINNPRSLACPKEGEGPTVDCSGTICYRVSVIKAVTRSPEKAAVEPGVNGWDSGAADLSQYAPGVNTPVSAAQTDQWRVQTDLSKEPISTRGQSSPMAGHTDEQTEPNSQDQSADGPTVTLHATAQIEVLPRESSVDSRAAKTDAGISRWTHNNKATTPYPDRIRASASESFLDTIPLQYCLENTFQS